MDRIANGSTDSLPINDEDSLTLVLGLNGTYTIGGTTPDYDDIAEAIDELEYAGVCGPVTFWLRDGTYSGSNAIGAISGASSTNTIYLQIRSVKQCARRA